MAVSFPCKHCKKMLKVDLEPGTRFKCPHCAKLLTVPLTIVQPDQQDEQELTTTQQEGPPHIETLLDVVGKSAPFVISVLFHLGLILGMLFTTMYILHTPVPEDVIFPDAAWSEDPGGTMQPTNLTATESTLTSHVVERKHRMTGGITGRTNRHTSIIAPGRGGTTGSALLRPGVSVAGGPSSDFLGSGGNAHHIVYVIDRSGSMVDTWDHLARQMLVSISKLRPFQDFHVILFTGSTEPGRRQGRAVVIELSRKQLVAASMDNKVTVANFLKGLAPVEGPSSNPIPALERAFAILRRASRDKPGKLIYLLTDAQFTADSKQIMQAIRRGNADKSVRINTFLYGERRVKGTEELMKQIAEENGGQYRYVSPYD